jgi:hypothetical protein
MNAIAEFRDAILAIGSHAPGCGPYAAEFRRDCALVHPLDGAKKLPVWSEYQRTCNRRC